MTERQRFELLKLLEEFDKEHILEVADAQIKVLEAALSKWMAFQIVLSDPNFKIEDIKNDV